MYTPGQYQTLLNQSLIPCTLAVSALFLGTPVPRPGVILASPRREHFIYGLLVVFGQYVVGCLCTPLDRLADKAELPRAEVGDLVAVFCAGAYGASASPMHFLGQGPALEILV